MTATMFSPNAMQYPFGQQTSQAIGRLVGLNTAMARLGTAIATASSGYDGVNGTQFEAAPMGAPMAPAPAVAPVGQNLFGVIPDPDQPGKEGQTYAYAMGRLSEEWTKFWDAAKPFIEQLDNGQTSM